MRSVRRLFRDIVLFVMFIDFVPFIRSMIVFFSFVCLFFSFVLRSFLGMLCSDERLMPTRRAAWSAWNYLGKTTEIQAAAAKGQAAETKPVFVTYWLNKVCCC